MGVFEFLFALVLVSTAAKIIGDRQRRSTPIPGEYFQVDAEELRRLSDAITQLSGRVERLEEERDFYKDLLEPPPGSRELPPPDSGP